MDKYKADSKRAVKWIVATFIAYVVIAAATITLAIKGMDERVWFSLGLESIVIIALLVALWNYSKQEKASLDHSMSQMDEIMRGMARELEKEMGRGLFPQQGVASGPIKRPKVLDKSPFEPMGSIFEPDLLSSLGYKEDSGGSDLAES